MTTPNIEELITYLRGFFIDEKVTAVKANQIADALQSQAERIKALAALEFDGFSPEDLTHRKYVKAAIESLKAALAQQGEQAIGYVRTINGEPTPDDNNTVFSYGANPYRDVMGNEEWVAVYTAAPAPQPAKGGFNAIPPKPHSSRTQAVPKPYPSRTQASEPAMSDKFKKIEDCLRSMAIMEGHDRKEQLRDIGIDALRELQTKSTQQASEPAENPWKDARTWSEYVAGMVGCYLNEPVDSEKCKAIAGIIERRLWVLPAAPEATTPEASQ